MKRYFLFISISLLITAIGRFGEMPIVAQIGLALVCLVTGFHIVKLIFSLFEPKKGERR